MFEEVCELTKGGGEVESSALASTVVTDFLSAGSVGAGAINQAVNVSSEKILYGATLVKNASAYTAKKVYDYEWRENIKTLSTDIMDNVFPKPLDPRPEFLEANPVFEDRLKLSEDLNRKYPNMTLIILQRDAYSHLMPVKKKKLLVPNILNVGELIFTIRQLIPNLNSYEGITLMTTRYDKEATPIEVSVLTNTNLTVRELFNIRKSEDNFLYISIKEENVFGC